MTDPELSPVKVDRGQIQQVILNLAVNARDAMPDGGRLRITTERVNRSIAADGTTGGGDLEAAVLLSVSDDGCGMSAETRARIFDPFFTTKEPGKGTGLGLATVYGIVKQSGGETEVESAPGEGATFRIYLPAANEPLSTPLEPHAGEPNTVSGSETVLLVEDQPSVRTLARVALESKGYLVLEAAGGEEALRLCLNHPLPIHLLVTDLVMPGLNGREIREQVLALRPGTRTLYISGYTDDEATRHGMIGETTAYLQKPFTPATLASKVREVLDR
jgi:CheY-like chemotaxis protein